ncbi:MAG TPA: hypothetical protein VN408_21170 [Actinoplanes sp.]|nr:hypothetical protein [Actinoplanes sp.]
MRRILGAGAISAVVLVAAANPVLADPGDVDLNVTIEKLTTPGELTMTVVANTGITLLEHGSDASARQFTGTLPTVTVSDTRDPATIPAGSFWAVVGQAGPFTPTGSTGTAFGPQYLGWAPQLLTGSQTGAVAAGEPVSSVVSDGTGAPTVGLQGQELLVSTANAADETGSWQVNADLTLRTPTNVAAGQYRSTLTLSLFDQS